MALPSCSRRRPRLAALTLIAFLTGVTIPVWAEPLSKEACDALADEQAKLVDAGVKEGMAGGAEGARARLGAQKLAQVQRFLTVDEQLLFRCGQYKARFVPPPEPEEPAEAAAKGADAPVQPAKGVPAKAKESKATPKPKPKTKPKTAEKTGAPEAEKAKAVPPPAKRKPKVDDAYRPPASSAPVPAQAPPAPKL